MRILHVLGRLDRGGVETCRLIKLSRIWKETVQ